MAQGILGNQSLPEYFKELVDTALEHQHLHVEELTSYYLVNMLTGFARTNDGELSDEPLALSLGRALDRGGRSQRHALQRVGDRALFVTGFFPDSLNMRLVDVDYYAALGGFAYGRLSQDEDDDLREVFGELAEKFIKVADLLGEISECSALAKPGDLLRLYERWLRTGSRRDGQRLVERGIAPNSAIGNRFVQ